MMDVGPERSERRQREKKSQVRPGRRKPMKNHAERCTPLERQLFEPIMDERSIMGARSLRSSERKLIAESGGPPDAFVLFCAYHLGITTEDRYQKPCLVEVAHRFGITVEVLQDLLRSFGLDDATIKQCPFDLEGAKLDIRVVPPGLSRTEIARELFQDFLSLR